MGRHSDVVLRPARRSAAVAVLANPNAAHHGGVRRPARGPIRNRYSLPALAFMIAFAFLLVYIIVPRPADSASAAVWESSSTGRGQTVAVVGGVITEVIRDTYGVTKKAAALPVKVRVTGVAPAAGVPNPGSAQAIGHGMVLAHGWGEDQYSCLVALWNRESGWNVYAYNPSGAYGIPQALPGSKMASAGADWQTNPATQIAWGLGYITARYGTPCGAWANSQAKGWY